MHNIHMIEILILDNFNFASRTTAVNQIKSFVKNKKKLLLQTSPIGFSLNLEKNNCSTIRWTLLVNNVEMEIKM